MANQVPKGKANAEAITNALKLTCKDLSVISIRSASRDHISRNASAIPAHISLMSKPSRSLRHTHRSGQDTVSNARVWHMIPARLKTSLATTAMGRAANWLQNEISSRNNLPRPRPPTVFARSIAFFGCVLEGAPHGRRAGAAASQRG